MRAYCARYYDAYFVGVPGDTAFYVSRLRGVSGPVLEVGAGTGRLLLPLAEAGVEVIGLEPDAQLVARARRRLARAPARVRKRVRLVQGLVQDLDLGHAIGGVLIPYRGFQHLLTPADQCQALGRLRDHLRPEGRLWMDTYDPLAEMLRSGPETALRLDTDFLDPETGRRVNVWYARRLDLELQLLEQDLIFEEVGADGRTGRRTHSQLVLRYTPRQEMVYLLERCGFAVEELYGDFAGGPYRGSGNQVWVVRRT